MHPKAATFIKLGCLSIFLLIPFAIGISAIKKGLTEPSEESFGLFLFGGFFILIPTLIALFLHIVVKKNKEEKQYLEESGIKIIGKVVEVRKLNNEWNDYTIKASSNGQDYTFVERKRKVKSKRLGITEDTKFEVLVDPENPKTYMVANRPLKDETLV